MHAEAFIDQGRVTLSEDEVHDYNELYDIQAECRFLRPINPDRKARYIRESLIHTFDEHLARLKFGEGIHGFLLADGRAEFLGADMTASWMRTAEVDGYGSRNWLESMGYLKAIDLLKDPLCEQVVISSPEKEDADDRRYMVVIEKQSQAVDLSTSADIPIVQYTIMIGGDRLGFSHAQLECQALCDVAGIPEENRPAFANPAEVLVSPIPIPYGNRQKAFDIAGIDVSDVVKAKLFHDNLDKFFGEKIDHLAELIVEVEENYSLEALQKAQEYRDILFKMVDENMNSLLSAPAHRSVSLESVQRMDHQTFTDLGRSFDKSQMVHRGRLPCPSAKGNKNAAILQKGGSLMTTGKMSAMEARMDPNLCRCILHAEPHFHCEGLDKKCNHPIPVGHGITTCSACGAGKVC